jgi:hypothetical protein
MATSQIVEDRRAYLEEVDSRVESGIGEGVVGEVGSSRHPSPHYQK